MKAYVFPGQGAQFPGMAKDLYDNVPLAKKMLEEANDILGFRITDIMFEGTADDLKATKVTQPAIFLHSTVLALCLNIQPDMVAGHSLGEFSALAAAKAMKFEDALRLVAIRAREMQKCCEQVPGLMAAIIGLSNEQVEEICAATEGTVIPANYNCDGQIVISGEKEAVEKACEAAKAAGAKRALPLAVSGAFHSPLMEPARIELGKAIETTEIVAPVCPVYQNVTGNRSGSHQEEPSRPTYLSCEMDPVCQEHARRRGRPFHRTRSGERAPGPGEEDIRRQRDHRRPRQVLKTSF